MDPGDKPIIAIAAGDPAGIGPEISIKAALDAGVHEVCNPIVVSDCAVIERQARACRIRVDLRKIRSVGEADWSGAALNVLDCSQPELASLPFGTTSAAGGRASLAFAAAAVQYAAEGSVDAVVAAPQNEISIALAGIPFDGYPSFVARETGTNPDDVYLMLHFDGVKIVHTTLHQSVRQALVAITRDKVLGAIRAAEAALRKLGITKPRIAVGGLNPHASEGGLFGSEEREVIEPAIETAVAQGITAKGPFATDTMFHRRGFDAFIVMLHDQGHIAAKLLAPNATAALTIGTPILFSSVAHGGAHDIAGKGRADPAAMIAALLLLSKARERIESQPVA